MEVGGGGGLRAKVVGQDFFVESFYKESVLE